VLFIKSIRFRKDINGLRAIAVIAVVLFHFNETWLLGGFAGVDVFFVISGFLMTGIIFRGIEQENFSILKFYIARADRLIPALALLCITLLIFGWFFLIPLDYKILSKHVGSSMGFLSNIIYWRESGYFDVASREKWLLHTWSLSVEWQFYLIYPVVLVAMRKIMPLRAMKAAILLGTILGFSLCVVATYKWINASYYLLPARMWEMMIGGVAYLYPVNLHDKRKKITEWVGLTLIASSYLLVSKESPWPGYLAIFPVLGSFLIIQAQREDSLITGNVILQKLGSWSYSIYLWHWPIVVAIYYFSLSDIYVYTGIILSLLLGFLSQKYIERIKFSNDFGSLLGYLKCKSIYILLIAALPACFIFFSQGVIDRFDTPSELRGIKNKLSIPLRNNGYCFYSFNDGYTIVDKHIGSNCYLGSIETDSNTLLFGDSYAGHNEPFFDEVFKTNGASFQSIVTNWCTPSFSDNFTGPKTHLSYKQCLLNREYLKDNMHKYKNIIFAGSWDSVLSKGQLEDVELVIKISAEMGGNIFIMAAPYRYSINPLAHFYRSVYFKMPFDINAIPGNDVLMSEANARLKEVSQKYSNVYFIDRSLIYAGNNTFTANGITIPYSLDGGHISILGSIHSAKYFMNNSKYDTIMNYLDLH